MRRRLVDVTREVLLGSGEARQIFDAADLRFQSPIGSVQHALIYKLVPCRHPWWVRRWDELREGDHPSEHGIPLASLAVVSAEPDTWQYVELPGAKAAGVMSIDARGLFTIDDVDK